MFNPDTNAGAVHPHGVALSRRRDQGEADFSPDRAQQVLDDYLTVLSAELAESSGFVDLEQVQGILLALSSFLRSAGAGIGADAHLRTLDRLTEIYARGIPRSASPGFKMTADGYAGVIETISRAYPTYDYGEAVGQLLCYTIRLFKTGNGGWKTVFQHLLAMPDAVKAKQSLAQTYFWQVQEWTEAGVDNLFSIRREICERIGELAETEKGIGRRIEEMDRDLRAARQKRGTAGNVIDLAQKRGALALELLRRKRQTLIEEKAAKELLVGLIDDDIQEFEGKLRDMRRAYSLRLV